MFLFTVYTVYVPAYSIYCYRCVSTIAGCGDQLNIRLQKWHKCKDPPNGGGENLCVKVIETRDGTYANNKNSHTYPAIHLFGNLGFKYFF